MSQMTRVWFLHGAETLFCPLSFCIVLSLSVHWHMSFYNAKLSIIFFLGSSQWQSSAARVLTLNMNIQLPLFWTQIWSTWSGGRAARGMGMITAFVYPLIKSAWKGLANSHCFSWNYKKYLKNSGPHWGFFSPHPPDWLRQVAVSRAT